MADWKDILADNDEPLSEEELLRFVKLRPNDGTNADLSPDDFEAEAIEGLKQVGSEDNLKRQVAELKTNLHKQLKKGNKRKAKPYLKDLNLIIVTVVLLLLLFVVTYVIIQINGNRSHKNWPASQKTEATP